MGWIALLALLLCLGLVAPAVALEPSAAVFSDPRIIKIGDKLFAKNCSRGYCHGKDGRAGRGPRFRGRTLDKSYMFKVTRQGVPGTSMAPVGEKLSDAEIWSVVAYLSSLSSVDPQGEPLTTAPPDSTEAEDLSAADLAALVGESPDNAEATDAARAVEEPESFEGEQLETTPGDPARGRELFFDISREANCGGCHRVDGIGGEVGPDLKTVAKRTVRTILRDILVPDTVVAEEGQLLSLTTSDGEQLQVVHVGESATRVKVYDLSSLPPVKRSIKKDVILTTEPLGRSAMPADFSERYTFKELVDIIAFLKSFDPSARRAVQLGDFF